MGRGKAAITIPTISIHAEGSCSSRLFLRRRDPYHRQLMSKRKGRGRRRTPDALRASSRCAAGRRREPVRSPLARLLDAPHLARLVPHLAPETLHQLIRHSGLHACARARRLRNTRATDVGSRPRLVAPRPAGARRTVRRGSLWRMGRSAGGHRRDRRGADRGGPGRAPRDCRALPVRARLRPVGDRSARVG